MVAVSVAAVGVVLDKMAVDEVLGTMAAVVVVAVVEELDMMAVVVVVAVDEELDTTAVAVAVAVVGIPHHL